MNIQDCTVGTQVYFGRKSGEKTLGVITKVNRKTVKVKQLESRGARKAHAVGTVWTVPFDLLAPVNASGRPQSPSPAPQAPAPSQNSVALSLGFQGCVLGQTFKYHKRTYTVIGYKASRPKYPITGEGPRGGRYKFTVDQVKAGMSDTTDTKAPKAPSMTQSQIISRLLQIEAALSPENLHCDGEISRSQAHRKARVLERERRDLTKLLHA